MGLHMRSRGKKNGGTKRWAAIHVANHQMHSQLPPRAQDRAACRALGLSHVTVTPRGDTVREDPGGRQIVSTD